MATVFAEDVQVPDGPIPVLASSETLVIAGDSLSWQSDHGKAVIRGWVEMTVGTGTTEIDINIYRGNQIGGSIVDQQTRQSGDFTPGKTSTFTVEVVDVLQNVGGAQYCMSVQQIGATGNGVALDALIDTTILSG